MTFLEETKELATLPTVDLGSSAEGIRTVKAFLARFGYLGETAWREGRPEEGGEFSPVLDERTAIALLRYQELHSLRLTANFDEATREMMSRPRCGVPDVDPATGIRFDLTCRWKRNTLSYAFANGTADVAGDGERDAVRRAFATWSAAVPLAFQEVGVTDRPDIRIDWTNARCGDRDMTGTVLAHADFPPGCGTIGNALPRPLHLDDQEHSWVLGATVGRVDVETVALHEIGHILGMLHSEVPGAVMFASTSSGTTRRALHPDDLEGIRRHYQTVGPLFARHSGLCLDIAGVSTANGADATQWEYVGGKNQIFQFHFTGEGYDLVLAEHSGRVLDVEGISTANGAQVHQWDWWRGDNQRFRLESVGHGYYKLVAKHSGKCLDVRDASQALGAKVVQWDWWGGDNQQWRLGHAAITARHSGRTLDVKNGDVNSAAPVVQWGYWGGANQRFRLDPVGDGYYRIMVEHSGKCLDVRGISTVNGALIQQWDYWGGDNQKFKPISTGNGYYKLIAKHSGKCVDVSGISTADGAQVQQWDYVGGKNQQWRL
ncbi:RICIN domain-containing protein [Streptomyces sp. 8N114]|uniref:RICIN domain-containing protein n=1 Tax=Streptomyces sp. 8N114 TaxID=3457419 RepID=UPI003FD55C79